MKDAGLLTVHGMGETRRGYADQLEAALRDRLGAAGAHLIVQPAYYQHILQAGETEVWQRSLAAGSLGLHDLRKFILFGFGDAAGLETRKEDPGSTYEEAQFEIVLRLLDLRKAIGDDGAVVVVAQSLGGQVFSSYLWDAQRAEAFKLEAPGATPPNHGIWRPGALEARLGRSPSDQERRFLLGATLSALVTTGCNIPIFIAAHQDAKVKAIERPNDRFQWLNLFDPDDVLGWPLRPLLGGYESLVQDHRINAGGLLTSWNPLSHTAYWTDGDVLGPLVEQLRRAMS